MIYEKIANEIFIETCDDIDRKTTIHRARYIVLLDNVGPPLTHNKGFSGDISSTQERSFY